MGTVISSNVEIRNRTGAVVLPRKCLYPPCKKDFTPSHPRYDAQKFCCEDHKKAFWKLAAEIGERALLRGSCPETPLNRFQTIGQPQNVTVLTFLRSLRGKEIEDPARHFPGIVWH